MRQRAKSGRARAVIEATGTGQDATLTAEYAASHRKGGAETAPRAIARAVRRPQAWQPPRGAKLSRNQMFRYRRRAVEQYAEYLGLDLRLDGELLWLAEEGLYAAVPEGYKEMRDLHGTPYYYHLASRTVSWEHPLDAEYRNKMRGMRTIHDLADPGIGKIRTWLKEQADGAGAPSPRQPKRTLLQRVLQVQTGKRAAF